MTDDLIDWLENEKEELEANLSAAKELGDSNGVSRLEGAIEEIEAVMDFVEKSGDSNRD